MRSHQFRARESQQIPATSSPTQEQNQSISIHENIIESRESNLTVAPFDEYNRPGHTYSNRLDMQYFSITYLDILKKGLHGDANTHKRFSSIINQDIFMPDMDKLREFIHNKYQNNLDQMQLGTNTNQTFDFVFEFERENAQPSEQSAHRVSKVEAENFCAKVVKYIYSKLNISASGELIYNSNKTSFDDFMKAINYFSREVLIERNGAIYVCNLPENQSRYAHAFFNYLTGMRHDSLHPLLMKTLRDILHTLSVSNDDQLYHYTFSELIKMVEFRELSCVSGTIVRLNKLAHMMDKSSIFFILYEKLKEDVAGILLTNGARESVNASYEIHMMPFLDYKFFGVHPNLIHTKDIYAAHLIGDEALNILFETSEFHHTSLEHLLAKKMFNLISSFIQSIDIQSQSNTLDKILQDMQNDCFDVISKLIPHNKTLLHYMRLDDNLMPTGEFDEFAFIQDIRTHIEDLLVVGSRKTLQNLSNNFHLHHTMPELLNHPEESERLARTPDDLSIWLQMNMHNWLKLDCSIRDHIEESYYGFIDAGIDAQDIQATLDIMLENYSNTD